MNKRLKFELIKEAQRLLVNNPQDYAHDITHHSRVWLLAKEIVSNINEKVDLDILELICWWHDVDSNTGSKDKKIVENTAEYVSSKIDGKEKEIVSDSILFHEFGKKPRYIEGKILQDADKLEILSEERLRILKEAVDLNLYDKSKFKDIIKDVIEIWLPVMPERYNFDYSRKLHFKRLAIVQPLIERIEQDTM